MAALVLDTPPCLSVQELPGTVLRSILLAALGDVVLLNPEANAAHAGSGDRPAPSPLVRRRPAF